MGRAYFMLASKWKAQYGAGRASPGGQNEERKRRAAPGVRRERDGFAAYLAPTTAHLER